MMRLGSSDSDNDDMKCRNGLSHGGKMDICEPDAKVSRIEDSMCSDSGNLQRNNEDMRRSVHTPSRIPPSGKKKYPQRPCTSCRRNGVRRDSCFYCQSCPDSPVLCRDCFREYHL